MLAPDELKTHIRGCIHNSRESQKIIYKAFYGYGMAICDRYTKSKEDAMEIYNESFLKIFKEIYHFKPAYASEYNSFKGWIRKILIFTAIDYNRKYHKEQFTSLEGKVVFMKSEEADPLDRMAHEDILAAIRDLSPAYRTVLNMFIVDGFSHEEIAQTLGISVGTSKSNLFKGRQQLKKILITDHKILATKNAG